ncbi:MULTISPECIES: helix-turn-helix transcriptional regulator [unclassified Oceanobacillus]|uniref:helix-turn-helix domain-containing protein n=1 Tax=unclassified Oceanobacillus TaxID=2630292 RepID=UPI001BE6041F|nr:MULTISPECIES: helix-turn-helix transcriptional regulator [unclassified Oceanobacillus]MBT2600920.1 helix-turn-helix transcriptional regulator [Oceanobacillus sp. ISL-74]MBT2653419.1 helix-turn-helix transcriptional regulator [Oceanobacillus sp. ISL-73]
MEERNNELSKFVGSRIREYRKKKKLTQKDLGDIIGVKHNTISNYENGVISPEQDMLFAISRALEVKVDDLFPSGDKISNNIDKAVQVSKANMSIEDLDFFNNLTKHADSLDEQKREELIKGIKFAVDFINNSNK